MLALHTRFQRTLMLLLIAPAFVLSACGGDEKGPEGQSAGPDESSQADGDSDERLVCELFSEDEVREATGYDVVKAEGNTTDLPMCEWELDVPESSDAVGLPLLSIVLLPENEYRGRTEPLGETLEDIDGPGDEVKFRFAGGEDGIPVSVAFFALDGNQGLQITPGFGIWDSESAAKSALLDMAAKVFERL